MIMMRQPEAARSRLTQALVWLRISGSVLSSMTIALTSVALGICVFYALGLLIGGFGGRVRSAIFILVALLLTGPMVRMMVKATSEEGLQELKRNRAFELSLLVATIARNSLSAIILFRLALNTGILFGEKGVDEGLSPLWHTLRHVILD